MDTPFHARSRPPACAQASSKIGLAAIVQGLVYGFAEL
jgi:hypothetical protein